MKKKASHKTKRISLGIWVLMVTVLVAELLGYTWLRVQCIKTGYEIADLELVLAELTTKHTELDLELSTLKSPERIAAIARTKLGLVNPSAEQVIALP